MKTNHSKLSSLLFNTDDTKKCLWNFSSPSFMRDYKDIYSAGYAVVLFCEYAFQNAKIPGIPSGQKMIFRGWPESHFLFTAPTRCSIVLSSQQAKSSLLSQLYDVHSTREQIIPLCMRETSSYFILNPYGWQFWKIWIGDKKSFSLTKSVLHAIFRW